MSEQNNDWIGEKLIQLGWRQGSLFQAEAAPRSWLVRHIPEGGSLPQAGDLPVSKWKLQQEALASDDFLVVASQTCDLRRSPQLEPLVEVIRAYWTGERNLIHEAGKNSTRRFLLRRRTTPDGKVEGLIADVTVRLQIAKEALLGLTLLTSFGENDQTTPLRFQEWLGKRYDRVALPDDLVTAVQRPLIKAIDKLRPASDMHRLLDGVSDILFLPKNNVSPFTIDMLFIRDERSGTPALSGIETTKLAKWVSDVLKKGSNTDLAAWEMVSTKEITVFDYDASYELPTDQYSLAQDDMSA